jgi:hypothetical protein
VSFFWTGLVSGIVALCYTSIGVYGLVIQKPLILPARINFWSLLIVFIPNITFIIQTLFKHGFDLVNVLIGILYIMLFTFFWRRANGYIIYGITRSSLKMALDSAVEDNKVLRISTQKWMGTIEIEVQHRQQTQILRKSVRNLQKYFILHPVKTNSSSYFLQVFFGIILFCFAIRMLT